MTSLSEHINFERLAKCINVLFMEEYSKGGGAFERGCNMENRKWDKCQHLVRPVISQGWIKTTNETKGATPIGDRQ
jgi:hypothetical protein